MNQMMNMTLVHYNDNKSFALESLHHAIGLIGYESFLSPKENEVNKMIVSNINSFVNMHLRKWQRTKDAKHSLSRASFGLPLSPDNEKE